jgi:hypothetical protein
MMNSPVASTADAGKVRLGGMAPIFRAAPVALLLVSGCAGVAQMNAKVQASLEPAVTFTVTDLTAAAAAANKAGNTDGACYTFLANNLSTLNGKVTSAVAPVGVFSAAEQAIEAESGVATALAPTAQAALEAACGPLLAHVINAGMTVQAEALAIGATIAAVGPK